MPSSKYFRRQADTCLRLSIITSDDEVASSLVRMARYYKARADALERASRHSLPEVSAPTLSHDGDCPQNS